MEQFINAITAWLGVFFDAIGSVVGGTIKLFEMPAQLVGLPAEIFAAALLCLVLIALWRAMSKFIM